MEAYSVEDEGEGICFNVFCYNLQEGVILDYATGKNEAAEKPEQPEDPDNGADEDTVYILNTNSKKVHLPDCRHVESMSEKNKQESNKSEEELTKEGYTPCGTCKPFG
jgi:DNA-entry nuclease